MVPIQYPLRFIEEDSPFGDVTSDTVIPDKTCSAVIRAEQEGIIAGIGEASALFAHFGIVAEPGKQDGDRVITEDIVLSLSGNAKGILLVERTALNIIGRMSGIATQTGKFADIMSAAKPGAGSPPPVRPALGSGHSIKKRYNWEAGIRTA